MMYKVYFDGLSIYEDVDDLILKDPSLSIELNAAGSFQFKMPPFHNYYNSVTPWVHDVEVYEGENLIFFGRTTNDISIDLSNDKVIYCEGALGYFNDTVQRPYEWEEVSLRTFIETLIFNHNSQVASNRQFTLGKFPSEFENKTVYRKVNYETTFDCLISMVIDAEGGYLMARKENGVQYLDWITDFDIGTQHIQFGLNIVDINQSSASEDFFTSLIPLGPEISGVYMTVKDVNNGLDYIDLSNVSTYGRIFKVVEFNDAEDQTKLLELANKYIAKLQLEKLSITVDAAELYYIDHTYMPMLLGQKVQVYSQPHNVQAVLPIVKMDLNLSNGAKQVSVGTLERRSISEIIGSEGQGYRSNSKVEFDATPMAGSNRAVTSAGIFEAIGPLRFTVNSDKTIHVTEANTSS